MDERRVLRWLVLAVALVVGPTAATTSASAGAYTYDAPVVALVDVHQIGDVEATPFQLGVVREGSVALVVKAGGASTTLCPPVVATNTGSALADASAAAFRAADDPASIFIKNKHLASAGGNHAKFASDSISEVQGWVAQGLRSDGVLFLPNQLDGTFRAIVPAGQVIGTKGQTFIRVIVTDDGRVINAFPVVAG